MKEICMLTSELVVIIGGTLLFFGLAVWMAIYSRWNRQTDEPEIERSPPAENIKAAAPQQVVAEQPPELRPERKTAENSIFTPEELKSAVEEMFGKSEKTIGVRNKTFSR
jgi:hypothetical protein